MRFTLDMGSVAIDTSRCCDCGRHWAVEAGWSGVCPVCARRKGDTRYAELEVARKTIAALRGALTKAKRAKGGRP